MKQLQLISLRAVVLAKTLSKYSTNLHYADHFALAHEGGAGAMHKAIAKRASETFSLENEAAEVTKGVTEK